MSTTVLNEVGRAEDRSSIRLSISYLRKPSAMYQNVRSCESPPNQARPREPSLTPIHFRCRTVPLVRASRALTLCYHMPTRGARWQSGVSGGGSCRATASMSVTRPLIQRVCRIGDKRVEVMATPGGSHEQRHQFS